LIQSGLVSQTIVGEKTFAPRVRGTVLIAEDDIDVARVYQRLLHPAGFETILYTDGQQALDGIKQHKPHLIVLDLKLPSLHGLDIIYFLRKNKEYRVPIIICTGYPEFQNEFEIRSYPKCEFLVKPVKNEDFLQAIEKHAPPPPKPEELPEGEREKTQAEIQLEEDMEKARGVQAKLLPEALPDLEGFDIGTFYCSCKEVGGDYFDIIPIDQRHTGIMIADVSGKGVSGAMVMVMVRSIMKMVAPNHLSPRDTLIEVNKLIAKDMKMGMFVTALYMILDEVDRKLTICCAGHNPALVWRHKSLSGSYMKPSGMALGITSSSVFENALKEEVVQLDINDLICVYTDGVVEAMSPKYEEFGEEQLLQVVSQHVNKSCEEIIDSIYESILAHEDTAPRHDDISIIAIKAI
ncbi:MAG: response regulator, partial [Planctomycetota bacterium]